MCYPKPGPRCSAHAAALLIKAKHNQRMARENADPSLSFEEKTALNHKHNQFVEEALHAYDATPAGIKELQRRYRDHAAGANTEYLLRLKAGIALRKQQLEAIKTVDTGDIKHAPKKVTPAYEASGQAPEAPTRKRITNSDPRIESLIEESNEWMKTSAQRK